MFSEMMDKMGEEKSGSGDKCQEIADMVKSYAD